LQRFGFITTNSVRQSFNRRVLEPFLSDKKQPVSMVFAVPDHPWVDTADGAAVRIAMTVATAGRAAGSLLGVMKENNSTDGEAAVALSRSGGRINSDLSIGADVGAATALRSNIGLALRGITLVGAGFVLGESEAKQLGWSADMSSAVIKRFINGRDLTQIDRNALVIDFYGLTEPEAMESHPRAYQWIHDRVKPARDQNARASYRDNWWIFAEPRSEFRRAVEGLGRYIATPMTAKHRTFLFLSERALPDQGLVPIALADAFDLGILSSSLHQQWALEAGGTLEDRPRYNQSRCFDPFPFPVASDDQQARIRELGEKLDAHRKRQQAAHPGLTLTGMYNVLEKLRAGETLTEKERAIHQDGLVSVLRQLHDELDAAVLDAYGWWDLLPLLQVAHGNDSASLLSPAGRGAGGEGPQPARESEPSSGATRHLLPAGEGQVDAKRAFDEAILERLVALNTERTAEEARGQVRWLRPDFQHPTETEPEQTTLPSDAGTASADTATTSTPTKKPSWPKDTIAQVRVVADLLAGSPIPVTANDITTHFTARGPWKKRVPQLLDMLVALGRAHKQEDTYIHSN
jgi:hypothetical protein